MNRPSESRIILDLCGGSGAWSKPYRDAGYDVKLITLPNHDVRLYEPPQEVHGILAAPPCTYFCTMRQCRGKPTDEQFLEGLAIVDACLRIIWRSHPVWWALENPRTGYLTKWIGQPQFKFQPFEYGDPWTKATWLWGNFNIPVKKPITPIGPFVDNGRHRKRGEVAMQGKGKASARSVTPSGFARAFFEANP